MSGPTLPQVLRTDGPAATAALGGVVAWVAFGVALAIGRVPAHPGQWVAFTARDPWPGVLTVGGTLLAVGVIGARTFRLRRLLRRGREVRAVVESTTFLRGRGRIWLAYPWQGSEIRTSIAVRDVPAARHLERGQQVLARVDPNHPDDAVLPLLFEAPST